MNSDFGERNFSLSSYISQNKEPMLQHVAEMVLPLAMLSGKKVFGRLSTSRLLQWSLGYLKKLLEWKQARLQSKQARRSFTDVVKEFVQYATEQGSKSGSMYYMSITKMEYAALELTEKGQKAPKDFRETLDCMDLCFFSHSRADCTECELSTELNLECITRTFTSLQRKMYSLTQKR